VKEPIEVLVTPLVIVRIPHAVHEHAAQAGVVQHPDALAGAGGVLAGAEVREESLARDGHDEIPRQPTLEQRRFHEPHSQVHHGPHRRRMQHGGRSEQPPGGHRREKPLRVVHPQRHLSRHAWRLLEERRRRDGRREGGMHRVEGLRDGVVAEFLENPGRNHAGSHFYNDVVF